MMIFKGRNRVTSGFRLAARPEHNGIDLVGDDDKTVHAVAGGTVGFAGIVSKSAGGLTWQWGYYVRIDGNDGRKYYYCHLAAGSLRVRAGWLRELQAGKRYARPTHRGGEDGRDRCAACAGADTA